MSGPNTWEGEEFTFEQYLTDLQEAQVKSSIDVLKGSFKPARTKQQSHASTEVSLDPDLAHALSYKQMTYTAETAGKATRNISLPAGTSAWTNSPDPASDMCESEV